MELGKDSEERITRVEATLDDPNSTPEQIAELYDTWHIHYDQDLKEIYRLNKHFDEFEDFVRVGKDAKILDVASGTGLSGQKLKERGYTNVDALDGSKGMLERAKEKGIYKNHIHALLGPSPIEGIEKDAYDVLICVGALTTSHLRYDCFQPLIEITKPGGYIYFIGAVEWLRDERNKYEEEMRRLQDEGKWRWVLMKESPDTYYRDDHALIYSFKVLK